MGFIPGVPVAQPTAPESILPSNPTFDTEFWTRAAEGAIRDYCLWHVAPVKQQTWALDGDGQRRLLLQTGRLLRVTSCISGGVDVTDRIVGSESGVIELRGGERFASGLQGVIVSVEHGYYPEEVPSIQALIGSLATRLADMFGNIVQQQSAGGSMVSFFAGSEHLMSGERAKLDRYRLRGRS